VKKKFQPVRESWSSAPDFRSILNPLRERGKEFGIQKGKEGTFISLLEKKKSARSKQKRVPHSPSDYIPSKEELEFGEERKTK